jgi:hypothetical protein
MKAMLTFCKDDFFPRMKFFEANATLAKLEISMLMELLILKA